MIRHHQHGETRPAEMARQPIGELIHLAFETRADIVDRRQQTALRAISGNGQRRLAQHPVPDRPPAASIRRR